MSYVHTHVPNFILILFLMLILHFSITAKNINSTFSLMFLFHKYMNVIVSSYYL